MTDIREIKSKEKIRSALLRILETKEPIEITIAEICSTAGVSRTTFYKFYRNSVDALDDLLDSLVEEVYMSGNEFYAFLMHQNYSGQKPLCEVLRRDRKYKAVVRDSSLTMRFIEKITKLLDEDLIQEISGNTGMSTEEIRNLFLFQLSGCFSAVRGSMNRTDEEWKKEKQRIDEFLVRGFSFRR